MAIKKKTPAKKSTKAKAKSTTKTTKQTPSGPTAEDLSVASSRYAVLRTQLDHAERVLESARSISTLSHRAPAVAAAMEKVAILRADAQEASELVAGIKTSLSSGNFYRTSALGRIPGQKPASAASKRGEPAPRKEKK